jgi:Zn finger protein HypA/HybF involved in hydrogenase expression
MIEVIKVNENKYKFECDCGWKVELRSNECLQCPQCGTRSCE